MATLNNPYALTGLIFLSLVSTFYCWVGMRQRNPAALILGIGTGIPSFDIMGWEAWAIGIVVCGLGLWLRSRMEGI